jgi:hypothetical protein
MPVITKLIGGLGNQLFQYACGRRLAHQWNVPLRLDVSGFSEYTLRNYGLNHFNVHADFAPSNERRSFPPVSPGRAVRQKLLSLIRPQATLRFVEPHFHFTPTVLSARPPVYLQGYWQSDKYFRDISSLIREEFRVVTPPDHANQHMSHAIQGCNAVSVHVRRGDYVSNAVTNSIHGICGINYYRRAVEYIKNSVSTPRFFVFSDDPIWSNANLAFDWDAIFVSHNQADKDYEDLRLMTLCQHHIIANSTFSWWGAWLGSNPQKIVIAPRHWFNTAARDTRDLIPAGWLSL